MKKKQPHIIIFNPDQWRGDVMGHLGNEAAVTPNLDELVKNEAVSFEKAFCQNPVCTPSRCSFMSGWYPHVKGNRTIFHMMQEDDPVLLRTLKQNGYFVWWGGKNDLIPQDANFDDYCDVKYTPPQDGSKKMGVFDDEWRGEPEQPGYYSFYAGKVEESHGLEGYVNHDWDFINGAIEQIKNAPDDKPMCIYLPLMYPHPPYAVEEPWFSMIDREKLPDRVKPPKDFQGKPSMLKGIAEIQNLENLSEEQWDELRATYYAMCARVDHQFGLVMDALKDAGIYDDTAVFFFSDHGDYTGDFNIAEKNQNTFEDSLTRVPFIVKPPSYLDMKPGRREALVELIDFPATVEDMLNIEPEHTHFGRSLLPLLAEEDLEHREAVFSEGGRLKGETHCMELEATDQQKPGALYYPRLKLQRSEGPEHTKAIMCRTKRYKYVRRLYEEDELYDLQADPNEVHNRINDPDVSDILLDLKERMLTFQLETSDVVRHKPDLRF
ncbi:sulfatase-like hydrolase/transferase [Gracilibacillus sp. S3-1-1]|uniref:Sulfatase-like hydrolase/transferase n=1 Tax=Gracilibacillus pellucidus TaxID=3095368 RepID=A0ACC6M8I2_9BACI|nr:sulfatase-like hydrolase/transferase [Gracilibacillus sp. S3-1-1]MDX8047280.1 sulfatase-like hydrolase/transferase [Gracilibacillus sp. S3-1-1]